jgi:hypothetical protein
MSVSNALTARTKGPFLFLITLVVCLGSSSPSPTPPPLPPTLQGTPITIGDPLAYLVQLRCPNGSDPTNCSAGSAVKQLTTDLVFYSKRDWPGAADGIISDSTLLANSAVLSPFYVGVYGHSFTPPNDGGDVYGVENGNATALKTRDGSLTRDLYFTGYSCGAMGWLLFPPTFATGAWNGQIVMIGQAANATTCNPTNLRPAYTRYQLVDHLAMPFISAIPPSYTRFLTGQSSGLNTSPHGLCLPAGTNNRTISRFELSST